MKVKTYNEVEKRYWTITDIAQELGIFTSTIRYWEKVIPKTIPKQRYKDTGYRKYTKKERDFIHRVHNLLHVQKYSAEGAKQIIYGRPGNHT